MPTLPSPRPSKWRSWLRIPVEPENYQPPRRGILLLWCFIAGLFFIFILRFWYLQVHMGEEFSRQAQANRLREERIIAPRGRILDHKGRPLADNRLAYGISLVREDCPDIPATLAQISAWTGLPLAQIQEKYRADRRKGRPFEPMLLVPEMSFEQAAFIEANMISWPGVSISLRSLRHYPEKELFAHLLGYVAEASEKDMEADSDLNMGDLVGRQGLELTQEKTLRGRKGLNAAEVDAMGRALNKRLINAPVNGTDVRLAIDRDLQRACWEALGGEAGSVVVMEPNTGKLRALVTAPSYDNNLFASGISRKNWEALSKDPRFPLQNRVLQSVYPPGSVWKLMMTTLFLEQGIKPEQSVRCSGSVRVGNLTFRCWKRSGHGTVNMRRGVMESCDVYFYNFSTKVGIDKISAFAKQAGFGAPTGIDLPHEKGGLVPSREWKKARTKTGYWGQGDTLNVSIGQGATLTTPLQIAVNIALYLNGGKVLKPQVLDDAPVVVRSHVPAAASSLDFVQEAMRQTARAGTARVVSRPDADMGGKTGTAQVVKLRMQGGRVLKTKELPWEQRDHAWIGTWGKKGDKEYIVVVMVEHGGGGSSVAGPVAKKVYDHLFGTPVRAEGKKK